MKARQQIDFKLATVLAHKRLHSSVSLMNSQVAVDYDARQNLGYTLQEAQLSPSDRAMRLVSSNLANCHATVQKLLIRQVLTKPMV